jgi:hypothetical protein
MPQVIENTVKGAVDGPLEPTGPRIVGMLPNIGIRFDVLPDRRRLKKDLLEVPFFEALLNYSTMRSILKLVLRSAIEIAHVFPFGPVHTQVDSGLVSITSECFHCVTSSQ